MSGSQDASLAHAYCEALFRARDEVWSRQAASTQSFLIVGKRVRCHFADSIMPALVLGSLAHHEPLSDGPADLDIFVWSGDESDVCLPNPPWPVAADSAWQCDTPGHFGLHLPILESLLWFDRENRRAIYWTPSARRIPLVERGSPLLLLWGAWLADFDIHLVHAAAVAGPGGAAMLLGPGGSGKSSSALSCLGTSLRYIGDDYCLLSAHPTPRAMSLYSSGKVFIADRPHYPHLEPALVGDNGEKMLYQMTAGLGTKLQAEAPIAALISMRIGEAPQTRLTPISAMQAIRAVAPNSLLQLRVGIKSALTLRAFAQVAREVPCYRMSASRDRREVADFLVDFLAA